MGDKNEQAPKRVYLSRFWQNYEEHSCQFSYESKHKDDIEYVPSDLIELLRECLPYVLSSAEASRMMDGFRPREHKEDGLAKRMFDAIGDDELRTAMQSPFQARLWQGEAVAIPMLPCLRKRIEVEENENES